MDVSAAVEIGAVRSAPFTIANPSCVRPTCLHAELGLDGRHFVEWSAYTAYQSVTAVARAVGRFYRPPPSFFPDQLVAHRSLMIDSAAPGGPLPKRSL